MPRRFSSATGVAIARSQPWARRDPQSLRTFPPWRSRSPRMRNDTQSFDVDLSKYDLKQYPDYRPSQPPDLLKIAGASYLDEFESVWGRQWGAMGIGDRKSTRLNSSH